MQPEPRRRTTATHLEAGDTLSESGYPTCVFMAERERGLESQILFHDVQIGVAHAGTTYLDDDLARAGRRLRNILDLSTSADANESNGLHDPSSIHVPTNLPGYCEPVPRTVRER
jgi:hypothetical protein